MDLRGRSLPADDRRMAARGERTWGLPAIGAALALAALVGVGLGVWLHHARSSVAAVGAPAPALRLPLLNGTVEWARGQRPVPAFVLRDEQGAPVSPAAQRGHVVLIAFLDSRGADSSAREARALATTEALLAGPEAPALDVMSLQPRIDTATRVRAAAARWGLPVGGYHWLVAPPAELAAQWHAFGLDAAPSRRAALSRRAVYLIDRGGWVRAGYLFPFPPTVLARDVRTLDRAG